MLSPVLHPLSSSPLCLVPWDPSPRLGGRRAWLQEEGAQLEERAGWGWGGPRLALGVQGFLKLGTNVMTWLPVIC